MKLLRFVKSFINLFYLAMTVVMYSWKFDVLLKTFTKWQASYCINYVPNTGRLDYTVHWVSQKRIPFQIQISALIQTTYVVL